jgi:hypothetical protein
VSQRVAGNRVKNFIEDGVADLLGPGMKWLLAAMGLPKQFSPTADTGCNRRNAQASPKPEKRDKNTEQQGRNIYLRSKKPSVFWLPFEANYAGDKSAKCYQRKPGRNEVKHRKAELLQTE